jgi:hypothetical protein
MTAAYRQKGHVSSIISIELNNIEAEVNLIFPHPNRSHDRQKLSHKFKHLSR